MADAGDVWGAGLGLPGVVNDGAGRSIDGGVHLPAYPNCGALAEGHRKDDLHCELWHACAGPLVHVPRAMEKVFYFPQGHMEQVRAYTNQDGTEEMPIYNLPAKILCKVVHVDLKAENSTDEVFAQVTLIPEREQDWEKPGVENGGASPQTWKTCARFFSKVLTPSDTSTHGGLSVPKRQADECLPPLDMSRQPPVQELVTKDIHGIGWSFRHIFRGQPKRHLITSGWSSFVTSKRLLAGDTCIFLSGENGELRVGIRRAERPQNNLSTSVISGHNMQHGILAGAFHAISTGTMFTVYYRPWSSPSEYIVPYQKYVKCIENDYSIGTRFSMKFEGDEREEQRCVGTVIGIEDLDTIRWPDSEWRCLKVQWDVEMENTQHPLKVSPWEIEFMDLNTKKRASVRPQLKRQRIIDPSFPMFSPVTMEALLQSGAFKGQESESMDNHELGSKVQLMLHPILPPTHQWNQTRAGLENESPILSPFNQYSNSTISSSDGKRPALDVGGRSENAPVSNVDSHPLDCEQWGAPLAVNDGGMEVQLPGTDFRDRYRLFGVDIFGPAEPPSLQNEPSIHISGQSKNVSGIGSGKRCKGCCSIAPRSCTKVLKHGVALGRSVDLSHFGSYDELVSELDEMFEFKGGLIDGSCGWHVSYQDDEWETMLIGSYPWKVFRCVARRIFIHPKEEEDDGKLHSFTLC